MRALQMGCLQILSKNEIVGENHLCIEGEMKVMGIAKMKKDVVIVGGGHNGLVAACYLSRAGFDVLVLEARSELGGPAGRYEVLPGVVSAFTNSPGPLEAEIISDLDLSKYGLRFRRPDPSLVHVFGDRHFLGWRDKTAVNRQLEFYAQGESTRYRNLISDLNSLALNLMCLCLNL